MTVNSLCRSFWRLMKLLPVFHKSGPVKLNMPDSKRAKYRSGKRTVFFEMP